MKLQKMLLKITLCVLMWSALQVDAWRRQWYYNTSSISQDIPIGKFFNPVFFCALLCFVVLSSIFVFSKCYTDANTIYTSSFKNLTFYKYLRGGTRKSNEENLQFSTFLKVIQPRDNLQCSFWS